VIDHDRLFKELLSHFLADFLALFAPRLAAELRPAMPALLDKEFFGPLAERRKGRRFVDVVARLRTKRRLAGSGPLVYVHVEAQASRDRGFPRRMLQYYAHLVARHGEAVYPIALLSHRSLTPEPGVRVVRLPGLKVVQFRYRVVQLSRLNWRDFEGRPNPAAAALMSRMGMEEGERPLVKAACWRMLAGLGLKEAQVRLLAGFVESYLPLDGADEKLFRQEIGREKEGERVMDYITSWEREARKAGRAEGRKAGRAEGRKAGQAEGRREGALGLLIRQLGRLGQLPEGLAGQVRLLSAAALQDLALAQIAFESLADLERWLADRSRP
jgi:hypothetical protein